MPVAPTHAGSRKSVVQRQQLAQQAWQQGCELRKQGRHPGARAAFERAAQAAPDDAVYWINLARSEHELGHSQPCIEAAAQAVRLAPGQWAFALFLVERLQAVRRYAEVLEALARHAETVPAPDLAFDWHLERGKALFHMGREAEAIEPCMQALVLGNSAALRGDSRAASVKQSAALVLGHCMAKIKHHAEAATCYRLALDAEPKAIASALYAAHYAAWVCDWDELRTDLQRLSRTLDNARAQPEGAALQDFSPFCLLGLSDDAQLLRWAAEHTGPNRLAPRIPRSSAAVVRPDGRLRLGLMSTDFHQHATSILMVQMLEHVDRDRYELYLYSGGPDDHSPMRARMLATGTQVHEVATWSSERLSEQIRADRIAVLFDLKGYTAGHRLDVMARRPAPVQVAWLGYPGTSGSPGIDYLIGDPVVTPLAHQADFTEALAQMPHCYQPNDGLRSRPARWSRAECGLPDDALVLASFNQSYKTTAEVFAAWCRILAATPKAVLWMMVSDSATQARLRAAAQANGIDGQRLVFAPFVGIESHRARLPQADLILDTFPCSGHTTSSDALWAGVPVLTLAGTNFAARVSASLLHTLGLDELICTDLDGYVRRALELTHDTQALADLHTRLAHAIEDSPLFDGRRFAMDWQALIERMVQRQDAGLPPEALAA
jgi:predicted O-linked N-acetylglucosamine transferase (SPINDLY family)